MALPDVETIAGWSSSTSRCPGQSGLSVLDVMQADPALSRIPVILLTARAGQRSGAAGFKAGAVDYITKPFSPEDLLARVRAAVV